MKKTERNIKWNKQLKNQKVSDLKFEELVVTCSKIKECEFRNIEFKYSILGSGTTYANCKFIDCQFIGRYTTMGSRTTYLDCEFKNCDFVGNMIFPGSIYKNCRFSGKMKNNIFINEKRLFAKPYVFVNCDLRQIEFENITFNGNRFFKSCKLPTSTIRIFRNDNDELIDSVQEKVKNLDEEDRNSLLIIFHKELRSGFNPFIIDKYFLNDFLSETGKKEFETIVKEFEKMQVTPHHSS